MLSFDRACHCYHLSPTVNLQMASAVPAPGHLHINLVATHGHPAIVGLAGDAVLTHGMPACSWAAYVAGALLVLACEQGASFKHGLSLLVSSAVPEGAGVSSSAALEVAAMQAIAAAHSLPLDGQQLALLCQKVSSQLII